MPLLCCWFVGSCKLYFTNSLHYISTMCTVPHGQSTLHHGSNECDNFSWDSLMNWIRNWFHCLQVNTAYCGGKVGNEFEKRRNSAESLMEPQQRSGRDNGRMNFSKNFHFSNCLSFAQALCPSCMVMLVWHLLHCWVIQSPRIFGWYKLHTC